MEIRQYKITLKETQESANSEIVYATCRCDGDEVQDKLNVQELLQKHKDLGFGYVRMVRCG